MILPRYFPLQAFMLLLLFSFGPVTQLASQSLLQGRILEKESKLPIPFATIVYQKQSLQRGIIADVDGKFELVDPDVNSITVSCVGYKPQKVLLTAQSNRSYFIVELETAIQEINEIVVTPANNPALRIIRKVLDNKAVNNFENYDAYSYRCYFKTVVDIKLADDASQQDSLTLTKNQRLKKQAPFISEAVIECLKSSDRIENKIIAQKTSGFGDPLLVQSFVSMFHKAISFYSNSIALFELPLGNDKSITEYVSPLSDGCLRSYEYELEDSYLNTTDTVFVINFRPKKGKNFNGLKGTLFISSTGFALKNIVVEPSEKGLIGFKFRQDYELIGTKWFPTKLDEEIGWVANKVNKTTNAYPVYRITSNIDNVSYTLNEDQRSIHLEKVYLDEASLQQSDRILDAVRPDSLSTREKNTYHVVDSLGRKHRFDYWATLLPKLAAGRIPVKWVDVDFNRLYNHTTYEGSRVGIGLYTNEKVSKALSLGGFVGYGLRDKQLKYGGELMVDINKYHELQLKLSYQNNLQEVGRSNHPQADLSNYLRSFMGSRFDKLIQKKIELGFRSLRFLKVTTSVSINEYSPTYAYSYKGASLSRYQADELGISATYAYGEELATIGNQRQVNYKGNPVITVSYNRGFNLLNNNSYNYNRLEATVDYSMYNGRVGQSNIRLASGLIDRSLPYGLLFTGEGSKSSSMPLLINTTFQTMLPYEFLSDRYLHLFYSHNFGSLLLNTPKFKPQFIVVQNTGWGSLTNASYQGIDFKTKERIYLESGLIINNLLKFNYINMFYLNVGVGGFYRYGYYGSTNFSDNFALKLSVTMSLK